MTRFEFDWEKAIQAIDFIVRLRPDLTHYYIGKIMFFADKEHVLDYGRPITGDRYVAIQHGPAPSAILDLLKVDSDYPDEMLAELDIRLTINSIDNRRHVRSKKMGDFSRLSGTDKQYLERSLKIYGSMSFTELKKISHKDKAYVEAWNRGGAANNEMNIELWLDELQKPELAKMQLKESASCAA